MTADEQRVLGRLEGQVETLTAQVTLLTAKVDSINQTLSQATGGWRMLLLVGGAGGGVGAFLTWLATFLNMKPGA